MSVGMAANNMYKIGDYVYFELSSTAPYQIRRIEELNKTSAGSVEARVMCFYRRRDISPVILKVADSATKAGAEQGKETKEEKKESDENPEKQEEETPLVNGASHSPEESQEERDEEEKPLVMAEAGSPPKPMDTDAPADAPPETNGSSAKEEKKEEEEEQGGPTVALLGMESISNEERHRLRHRELFLSRQIETLPATHIRGKCTVTLLNEMETPDNYLDKEDTFFYSLVYDSHQKTLLADKGEIRIGEKYQAQVPEAVLEPDARTEDRAGEEMETQIYHPYHELTDRQIDQFSVIARSVGTFARALDSNSAAKQPSLHMSAAAASRDVTLFHSLSLLHHAGYSLARAMSFLVPPPNKALYPLEADKTTGHRTSMLGGPLLCRDQLEEWSAAEASLFEEALEKYGKDFNDIRQDFLPWKSLRDIVEYYYMWKTTDRYIHQKRFKAVEAESRLKQVFIPTYNKPNSAALFPANPPGQSITSTKLCEGCNCDKSTQWYTWAPASFDLRLCQDCWTYWKHYGGLRKSHRLENYDKDPALVDVDATVQGGAHELRCPECKKPFDSVEKLQQHRAQAHPPIRCPIDNCRKECRGKAMLHRHLTFDHDVATPTFPGGPRAGGPKTPRTPFFLLTNPMTRVARRLAGLDLLNPRKHGRNPFLEIKAELIRAVVSKKSTNDVLRVVKIIPKRSVVGNNPKTKQDTVSHTNHRKRGADDSGNAIVPTKRAMIATNGQPVAKSYKTWVDNPTDTIFLCNNQTKQLRKTVEEKVRYRRLARTPVKSHAALESMSSLALE